MSFREADDRKLLMAFLEWLADNDDEWLDADPDHFPNLRLCKKQQQERLVGKFLQERAVK